MTDENEPAVVIERTLEAPIERVWAMWTRAEHFSAWYGPDGAEVPVAEMDVRVGGTRRIAMEMQTPNGPMRMWFGGEYREVDSPTRLVYTEFMADEDGNELPPEQVGMPEDHPTTTVVTVELSEDGDGTSMTMTHAGIPEDSPGAAGWQMALDKLAAHVAEA